MLEEQKTLAERGDKEKGKEHGKMGKAASSHKINNKKRKITTMSPLDKKIVLFLQKGRKAFFFLLADKYSNKAPPLS